MFHGIMYSLLSLEQSTSVITRLHSSQSTNKHSLCWRLDTYPWTSSNLYSSLKYLSHYSVSENWEWPCCKQLLLHCCHSPGALPWKIKNWYCKVVIEHFPEPEDLSSDEQLCVLSSRYFYYEPFHFIHIYTCSEETHTEIERSCCQCRW